MTFDDRIVNHLRAFLADQPSAEALFKADAFAAEFGTDDAARTVDQTARMCAAFFVGGVATGKKGELIDRDEFASVLMRVYFAGLMGSLIERAAASEAPTLTCPMCGAPGRQDATGGGERYECGAVFRHAPDLANALPGSGEGGTDAG